jgi:hypothetical protein
LRGSMRSVWVAPSGTQRMRGDLMFRLSAIPCWYLGLAVGVSVYQAYRGFRFQMLFGPAVQLIPGKCSRLFLLYLADAFTYFITTMTGFVSLFWFYQSVSREEVAPPKGQLGDALLIFLVLYGVLGVTGRLPDLLSRLDRLSRFKLPGTD